MASKLCLLYLLTIVGLGVVNAAPLELRQPNKAQCGAKQKKLAQDLGQMGDALDQLAVDMNMGNLTDVNNVTSLAVDNAADCPPAGNATDAADALDDGANEKKGKEADLADAEDQNNAGDLEEDNAVNATDPAVDETADCPAENAAADACTPPANKEKKKGKAADPVNAMDMGLALRKGGKSRVKVKVNTGGDQNTGEDQNNGGDQVQADLNVNNTVVVDPGANNVTDANNATAVNTLALGKKVGEGKNEGQNNGVDENNAGDEDQADLNVDDTVVADPALNNAADANNATAVDDPAAVNSTATCDPANNAADADPAVNSMKKAKKGVKDAEDALVAMMMGDQSVDMDQVNGNITLAADAMKEMNLMSNENNKKMSKVMSMAEDLQNDAELAGDACSNA